MLGVAAEQGSAVAMHNAAFLLQRGRGYNGSDAAALALELLLRAAAIEHQYGDGLVDAANLLLDADRCGCVASREPAHRCRQVRLCCKPVKWTCSASNSCTRLEIPHALYDAVPHVSKTLAASTYASLAP